MPRGGSLLVLIVFVAIALVVHLILGQRQTGGATAAAVGGG